MAISIWIFYESYRRFQDLPEILGGWMMAVALMGLFVNVAAGAGALQSGGREPPTSRALSDTLSPTCSDRLA